MIKIFHKTQKDKTVKTLEDFAPNTWIYIEEPTAQEREFIAEKFSLEPELLEDAVDIHEVPRVEFENDTLYIFTRYIQGSAQEIKTVPMLIILKKNYLITVTAEEFPRLKQFLSGKIEFNTVHRNLLLIKLLENIQNTFNVYLNNVSKKIQNISAGIEKIKNKDIVLFVSYENILNDFNLSLVRINAVLIRLMEKKILKLTPDEQDLIEDIYVDNDQLVQITKESLRNIINVRNSYSTIMTNNLNNTIRFFTAVTVILTIPTIIGSFFGMNVKLPFQDSSFAFDGIIIVTVIICLALLFIFYWEDWL